MKFTKQVLNKIKELGRLSANAYHKYNIELARKYDKQCCVLVGKLTYPKEYRKFTKAYEALIVSGKVEILCLYC